MGNGALPNGPSYRAHPRLYQNGPSKFCGEGLMLRAERTWRGRYLRVTRVTPLTFYPEWMVQVANQGRGRLRFMVALVAPLPGTTYAGTRWSTWPTWRRCGPSSS